MPDLNFFGKTLIGLGGFLVIVGLIIVLGNRLGLGRLPGDIFIQKGNFSFFFPVVTSILISIILTIIFNLLRR